ncbi:MAG: PD-(D/E)XK nuclease family protein [Treponema sp.]|jgi:hypothetical protein|nr:PD-(D/E)XK nuclease family protein [Treponema sp.]
MNRVESILLENIDKDGSLFIFPTDVAAYRWADHLLRLRGGTIAMDKFIAWDTFKQNSIRSQVQNRRSIASALRKIVASRVIRENADLCAQGKPPLFSALIPPLWARQAASFAPWLRDLLPQLGTWFKKITGLPIALINSTEAERLARGFDPDDRDLYILAMRYAQFLEQHGLFEPAWETPPFADTGKECFIFFPEALSDYSEYRELLAASGHVQTICAPESSAEYAASDVFFYSNSRSEITEAALYIRALHEREHIPWDSIAVSIPDAGTYEPYVLREFASRNIPFVRRIGKPLALYPAGQFFKDLANCASRDFAFSSLASLILNRHLPWKETETIQQLIEFGIKNNCVSSWIEEENGEEKPVNVWEDAFEHPFGGISSVSRHFFTDLKRRIKAMRNADSFAEIRKHYFSFRGRFFDMDKCLPETDLILSRCISELMSLVDIEKTFPDAPAPDPYMFFTEYLQEVNYLAQQQVSGVAILPYRTAAPAPFDCHIILGASQDKLSAVFPRLEFLPRGKREKLGLVDDDASAAFINLHRFNSKKPAAFFCAEQTFSGYAIPHSLLGAALKPRQRYGEAAEYEAKFSPDLYKAESGFYQAVGITAAEQSAFPPMLYENQKNGFEAWFSRRGHETDSKDGWIANNALLELIRERFCRNPQFPGKFSVSASSLAPYFQCSLRWLFERVLGLENVQIETGLMEENIAGLVYHAVLNLFFDELKKNGNTLSAPPCREDGTPELPDTYQQLLTRSLNEVFAAFPRIPPNDKVMMSALSARLLRAEQKQFRYRLENCLAAFLSFFAGYRVIGSETLYHSERDSSFLQGTVDCMLVDEREDSESKGAIIIVDFKLKNLPDRAACTGEETEGLSNFQLPMYLSLTEENEQKTVNAALFFSIVDAKPEVLFGVIQDVVSGSCLPKKEDERIMPGSDLFKHIMGEFGEKAEQFAAEISGGEFSVFDPNFEKCSICKYHRVCRTVYKIDCEQNLTSWGNNNGT